MREKAKLRLNRMEISLGLVFVTFSFLLWDLDKIAPTLLGVARFLKPLEALNILVIYGSLAIFFLILASPRLRARKIIWVTGTNVRLKNWEWYFLIFTTLFSSSLIYWPFFESFSTLQDPSFWDYFGADSSPFLAVGLSLFHWSLPWFTYVSMSIIFAYFLYSEGARALLAFFNSPLGSFVLFFLLCSAFFSFTSIFVFSNSFLAVIGYSFGLGWDERVFNFLGSLVVLVLVLVSLFLGFNKGIKRFSNFAGLLFFALVISLLLSYLLFAPSPALLGGMGQSLFHALALLVDGDFVADQWQNTHAFIQNWTAYFWALWLVNLVMISCFITFISQGRTYGDLMRALIVFGLFPSLFPFWILGVNGVLAWQGGQVDSLSLASQAIVVESVLSSSFLPASVVLGALALATLIYNSTNLDSFVFMARNLAYRQLVVPIRQEKRNPNLANELYFFCMVSLPALVLIARCRVSDITWLLKALILLPTSVLSLFMLALMGVFVYDVFLKGRRKISLGKRVFLEPFEKETPREMVEIEPSLLGFDQKHK